MTNKQNRSRLTDQNQRDVPGMWMIVLVTLLGNLTINNPTLVSADTTNGPTPIVLRQQIESDSLDAPDLLVEGTQTVVGGTYRTIHVKNGGRLTIEGDVSVKDVTVGRGTLNLYGKWTAETFSVLANGIIRVIGEDRELPGSGTFDLECVDLTVEEGGLIDGDGAGRNVKGAGGYHYTGGAAYGGRGGRGAFDASTPGSTYGDAYSFSIETGSRGTYNGGGSVKLKVQNALILDGSIRANGWGNTQTQSSGGSGGGVLLAARFFTFNGSISADGGVGSRIYGGNGGGGRIKLFFEEVLFQEDSYDGDARTKMMETLSVKGQHQGSEARHSKPGTIWVDTIPEPPKLRSLMSGALLKTNRPDFRFTVTDNSWMNESRDDDLAGIIEVSTDNFVTEENSIFYDQNVSLAGWSEDSYRSGDEAEFTPESSLPPGDYQWRVVVWDRSVCSRYSTTGFFTIPEGLAEIEASDNLPDLVVEGDVTVEGGDYGTIHVKNGGNLTLTGGQNSAEKLNIVNATLTIYGNQNNRAKEIYVNEGGIFRVEGKWLADKVYTASGGIVSVLTEDVRFPGSGTLDLECVDLTVEEGGLIDADGAGRNVKGAGGYHYTGGAGYGGRGGRGAFDASTPGSTYGDAYSFSIETGSRGTYSGGGSVKLIVQNALILDGSIRANGWGNTQTQSSGGSGGGVLLAARFFTINGSISADGGVGSRIYGGNGGGGRIKIFYGEGDYRDKIRGKLSVKEQKQGSTSRHSEPGTIWVEQSLEKTPLGD